MTFPRSATCIALLAATLTGCAGAEETPTSAVGAAANLSTSGVEATIVVQGWGAGYCASVTLANGGTSPVTSWTLVVALDGTTLTNMWGGTPTVSGGQMTVRPVDYTAGIAPAASVSFGFCGNGTGQPTLQSLEVVGGGGPTTCTLTVNKAGAGSGAVVSSPAGISCGSTCTASFACGTSVTLTATAASGSIFAGWSGACAGTAACTVGVSAAQTVTATFDTSTTTFPLTVTKAGTGAGSVSGTGIDCGSTCSASYESGTSVTLTAAAASGSAFGGWSGACTGSAATCAVSMTAARAVTATFTAVAGDTSSVNAGGSAAGAFVADAYFSGGSTYTTTNAIDTSQIAGAVPPQAVFQTERYGEFTYTVPNRTPGSAQTVTLYFSESYWTAAGQRTFDVAVNGATVLTAFDIFAAAGGANRAIARTFNTTASSSGQVAIQFTRAGGPDNPKICGISVAGGSVTTFPLTVSKAGSGGGTVTGGGIDCGSTCTASYASGTAVTLTAAAASGSTFAGWSGACTGTSTCTVSMTAARTVTATFNSQVTTYALTVAKAGTGSGTVASTPAGISCGSTCSASYASGTTVTLTATAAGGSTFGGWSGACTGAGTCTASMTAARTVTATFNGPTPTGALVGWATVNGTVTGGGNATPVTVTTLAALNSAAAGTNAAVIRVSGTITGAVAIGSNKTIEGANAAATIRGSIRLKASANVILRNLNVVGNNCTDASSCESGADAIAADTAAHHLWFDHLAISDGSDGNLDFSHAVDNVTVSWCKFFYTGRSGGHQYSNLIGHSDNNAAEDTGHLRVTFHHNWWADGVRERMPRIRFGQVHLYNNLYTSTGNNYCIAPAMGASVLVENNVFIGVSDPLDLSYGDGAATVRGNLFTSVSGNTSGRGTAFTPPYAYTLDPASSVEAAVRAGAGPR